MTREQALKLLHDNMQNINLRRHCYAVEAVMRTLYNRLEDGKKFQEEEDKWGIAGLLHDADYEVTKDDSPKVNHTKHILEWLKETDAHSDVQDAIAAHGWNYVEGAPQPKTKMQWALYTCDELTGLIVAVALVKGAKLSAVSADSVMHKWNTSGFAAGVDRKQIEMCDERLGIPLREFIEIAVGAMQGIHDDLGL